MIMKKIFKFTYTFLVLTCGMLICSLFSSCDNFLRTGDVREKMIAAREFEEAKTCKVLIKADSKQGDFLSAGEKTLKVGYDTLIQFTVKKKNYVFKGFEAVNVNNPKQNLAKYVTFTPVVENEEYGIYKYNVKLLDSVSNLLIRPVCVARPKIEQITPELESSGCEQNTPIQITFNKPVNPQSFGDFSCIQIFANENLAEYFETPVFSSDNKTLYIAVNPDKQIIAPNGPKTTLDIEVIYDFTQALDEDGVTLTEQGSYTYKINNDMSAQKKVVVMVKSVAEEGEFNSSVEKECIVGYDFDLVFTLNKDKYSFAGFEAVSSADNVTSRADCVSFQKLDYNDVTGVYNVSVRVLTEQQDILIRPVCKLRPYVQSISPEGLEPQYANASIVLTFNTQMEAPETAQDHTLFTYDNIYLVYTDSKHVSHNMSDYFELPVFDSQKKILTIKPKALSLRKFIKSENVAYIDLKISFSKKIDLQNGDYTVRYGQLIEETVPEKIIFFGTVKPITLQDETRIEDFPKFTSGTLDGLQDQYDNDEISGTEYINKRLSNKVKDCLYIYGKYLDVDSGVKKVIVTQEGFGTREFTSGNEDAEFYTDKNNYTSFCIKFNLFALDDVYNIQVTVVDACNNPAPDENFFVISKSHYQGYARQDVDLRDNDMFVRFYNQPSEFVDDWGFPISSNTDTWTIPLEEYRKNLTHLWIYPDSDNLLVKVMDNLSYTSTKFSFYCKYTDKDGIERNEKFNDYDEEKGYWDLDLNLDSLDNLILNIKLVDETGIEGDFELRTPSGVYLKKEIRSGQEVLTLMPDVNRDSIYFYYFSTDPQTQVTTVYERFNSGTPPAGTKIDGFIYGTRNGMFSDYYPVVDVQGQISVKAHEVIANPQERKVSVKFTFENNPWDTFDKINLSVTAAGLGLKKIVLNKGDCGLDYTYTFDKTYDDVHDKYYFNATDNPQGVKFQFDGLSSCIHKEGEPYYVDLSYLNQADYDTTPPKCESTVDFDYYTLLIKDEEGGSGPKSGTLTIKNVTYDFQKIGDDVKLVIPVKEFMKYVSSSSSYLVMADLVLYDNNNNRKEDYARFYYNIDKDADQYFYLSISRENETFGRIECCKRRPLGSNKVKITKYDGVRGYMYNPSANEWIRYAEGYVDPEDEDNNYLADLGAVNFSNLSNLSNMFIKVCVINGDDFFYPRYYYTGTSAPNGKYNFIINNGNSKDSFIVCSDASVLIEVFKIPLDYNICSSIDANTWCLWGECIQTEFMDFSSQDHEPRVFQFDDEVYNNISQDECYVVLAHFTNGNDVVMSPVMQK